MRKTLLILLVFVGTSLLYSQSALENKLPNWVELMYKANSNFGEVEELYQLYYESHEFVKNEHTQYFKRWKYKIDHQSIPESAIDQETWLANQNAYLEKSNQLRALKAGNSAWQSLGPFDFDKEAIDRSYAAGAAHVYTVEQASSNPNLLYAGTANAGLWKSIDKGLTWQSLTKYMMIKTIYALEIDPNNADIVYFGGDDGKLYKTIDGGTNWQQIGDASFNSLVHEIRDIVILNGNQNLLIASDKGMYSSNDGGISFSQIISGEIQEIEQHPTNNNIIYAVKLSGNKTQFHKSIDGGQSFTLSNTGWPNPGVGEEQKRTEIAVSADAPNRVYALATGNANFSTGLYGIYLSEDEGNSWTFTCCGPSPGGTPSPTNINLMGWDDAGQDAGGQYYYDLAFDVSPTNADSIFVGGVNLWVSGDAGQSFSCPSKWSHSYKDNYVHADIHDIGFFENDLWIACDGGIFYSDNSGETFERRMLGIEGTDFWGFGVGFWDGEVMLGGTYHNGTLLKDNNVFNHGWISTDGGDNTRGFVNPGDGRVVYSDYNRKKLSGDRSVSASTYPYTNKPNADGAGRESELVFDYECYTCFYTGFEEGLYYTSDNGSTYTLIHSFAYNVGEIEISRANANILYVSTYASYYGAKQIWRSDDKGQTWVEITPSSAEINGLASRPYVLAVSSYDAMEIFFARVGYFESLDGYKVFKSNDGGETWVNISTSDLDGEMIVNMVHQQGTDGGIWLGTRRAVYYKNNSMSNWMLYNDELPSACYSTRLVPYYRKGKIRNAGDRSVYEANFVEASDVIAQISVNSKDIACSNDTVYFADYSILSEGGATWLWQFPGGIPSSSNQRNPKVVYPIAGTYDVSLTVSDTSGSASQSLNNFITIHDGCKLDSVPGNSLFLQNSGDYVSTKEFDLISNTMSFSAWIKPSDTINAFSGIVIGGQNTTGGLNLRANMELAYHWPGGQWWWASGLFVPVGEWSHVAMVVEPSQITLYLNGIPSTHVISTDSCDFTNVSFIGSYKGWTDRNFLGEIDEVCIWKRSLSQNEIREQMHLSKTPNEDLSLLAYYQFNNAFGEVRDKANGFHANLIGNAQRAISGAPVGGGKSDRFSVSASGIYHATNTNSTLSFTSLNNPNGEIVISALNLDPNILPDTFPSVGTYWIINNYGTNQSFDGIEYIEFGNANLVSVADAASPDSFALYYRPFNSDIANWDSLDLADDASAGSPGKIWFNDLDSLTSLSRQFAILNKGYTMDLDTTPNSIVDLQQVQNILVYPNPLSRAKELNIYSDINEEFTFYLFDQNGKIVKETIINKSAKFSLDALASGLYYYQIVVDKYLKRGKIEIR
ncbi:MAG: T9SS type A sorting domain-containing protein [Chitinophagales bacterium]|nr:T9SS type A sorting domain-containing protein [Chitinophagales bacterium]